MSVDLSEPRRQSLWAVVFLALRTLRQIGVVQIIVAVGFVATRSPSLPIFLGLVALVGLLLFLIALLRWWRYTFVLDGSDVVVRQGVLAQQTLTVPLDRIQSVTLEQKLLHRLVSLVQISLDTAGTEEAEFTIDAVEQSIGEAIQRVAANHRATTTRQVGADTPSGVAVADQPPPPEQVILQHDAKRILRVALTQMPFAGLLLLAPIFAVFDDIREYIPFDLPSLEGKEPGLWLIWVLAVLIVCGLLFSILLNVVRVVLTDWNFKLTTTGAGLRRNAGLLSKTSVAATISRIQRVSTAQGILERKAAIHTVNLQTIGSANLQVPGCDLDQADMIRRLAFGPTGRVQHLHNTVSSKQVFLSTRNVAIGTVLAAAAPIYFFGWWAAPILLLVPWTWFETTRRIRLRRWGVNDEAIGSHVEFLGWTRHELLLRKVNGVTIRQGLFERKHDLASINLQSAAGDIAIGMIAVEDAKALRDHVLRIVETDSRAWM